MSIGFLFFADKARSGISVPFLKPAQSNEGVFTHPFQWNKEYYPCPECLSAHPQLLQRGVACAERYAAAVDAVEEPDVEGDKIDEFSLLRSSAVEYYAVLTQLEQVVQQGSTIYDATEFLLQRIFQARAECVFNLAVVWLLKAAKTRLTSGDVVQQFAEASGAFDALLQLIGGKEGLSSVYLTEEYARLLAALCLATAHEFSVATHYKDAGRNLSSMLELVHRTSFYFSAALSIAKIAPGLPSQDLWINYCSVKHHYYSGMLLYLAAFDPASNKSQSRRKKAKSQLELATREISALLPGNRESAESDIKWLLNRVTKVHKLQKHGRLEELASSNLPGGSGGEQHVVPSRHCERLDGFYPFAVEAKTPSAGFISVRSSDYPVEDSESFSLQPPSPQQARRKQSAASSSPLFRRGSLIATSGGPRVTVTLTSEDADIRFDDATIAPADSEHKYHFIQAVVSAGAPLGTATYSSMPPSPCGVVFVVDVNHTDHALRNAARTSICMAIKKANLSRMDVIGLVHFDSVDSSPTVRLIEASEENITEIVRRIHLIKGRGRFAKSKGTLLVQGVLAAKKALLSDCPWVGNRHIVAVSDGGDNSAYSDVDNWTRIASPETVKYLKSADVDIHGFSLLDGDHSLLERLSGLTFGNCAVNVQNTETAISDLRRWLATLLTDAKYRGASLPQFEIACSSPDIKIAATSLTSLSKPSGSGGLVSWSNQASLNFPSIPWDFHTSALVTFAVPSYLAKQDVIDLASVRFSYTDPMTKQSVEQEHFLRNVCCNRVVDKFLHHFAEQATLQSFHGRGRIVNTKGDAQRLRGSETARTGETICTGQEEGSHATFITIDGTAIELGPSTTVRIDGFKLDKISLYIQCGSIRVAASKSTSVEITTDEFLITTPSGGHVGVSRSEELGFSCECVLETVTISPRSVDAAEEALVLQMLQFTTAPPHCDETELPCAITTAMFQPWLSSQSAVGERLRRLVAIESQKMRLTLVSAVRHLTILLSREKRRATWPQKNINRYCRYIVMYDTVQSTKEKITSSLAYASNDDELDQLRVAFETVATFTTAGYRDKLRLHTLALCDETLLSLMWERNKGKAKVYGTMFQQDFLNSLMSAREKEEADAARLAEEEVRRARENEVTRRNKILVQMFQWFDFDGKNVAAVRDILNIFFTLPRQLPNLAKIRQRLMHNLEIIGMQSVLGSDQFAAVLAHSLLELSSVRFNLTALMIAKRSAMTLDAIEESRISRALFAVHKMLDDSSHLGYVLLDEISAIIREAWGNSAATEKRLNVIAETVLARRLELDDVPPSFYARPSSASIHLTSPTGSPHPGLRSPDFAGSPGAVGAAAAPVQEAPTGPIPVMVRSPSPTEAPASAAAAAASDAATAGGGAVVSLLDARIASSPSSEASDLENISKIPITLVVFIAALKAALADAASEEAAHELINRLYQHVEIRRKRSGRSDTTELLLRERKAHERPHLLLLDLKHCFDGVLPKHVMAVTNPNFSCPSHISLNEIAAPICILSGIKTIPLKSHVKFLEQLEQAAAFGNSSSASSPMSNNGSFSGFGAASSVMDEIKNKVVNRAPSFSTAAGGSTNASPCRDGATSPLTGSRAERESYWPTLQRKLRCDFNGFTQSLMNFPPLSVTNRLAQVVSQHMLSPALDPSVMLGISPVLAALVSWVRVMLRVVYLQHDFDEVKQPPAELVSRASAAVNHTEHLLNSRADVLVAQPPKAEQVTAISKKFSRHFAGVFLPPPMIGMSPISTFHAPSPPQLTVTEKLRASRPATANSVRASSAVAALSTPSLDQLEANRELSTTTSRPQSAYVSRATNTLHLGPSKKATSIVAGSRYLNEQEHMQQSLSRPHSAQPLARQTASR